jgi:uncharacterized protein (TIGR00369 family)
MSDSIDMLAVVRNFTTHIPFNAYLGIEPTEVSPGFVRLQVPFRPEFVGDPLRPALHGGVLAVLIDAGSGAAVWTLVSPYERISTIDMRVDYLLPGRLEPLGAEARVQRKGSHVAVASVRVYHQSTPDQTIAEGKAVFSIRHVNKSITAGPPTVGSEK